MILRERARSLLSELGTRGLLDPATIERAVAEAPAFQNLAYPLALPPLLVDADALEDLRRDVEAYVALLERVIELYRDDAQLKTFLRLPSHAEELIAAEGRPPRAITICRLDGYVEEGGDLQILENNADCPAGTLFTPRLNRLVRQLVAPVLDAPAVLPMDLGDPFIDTLVSAAEAHYGRRRYHAAVLQVRGAANVESSEVAAALQRCGHTCEVIDPRDLEAGPDGVTHGRQRLDLIWNKINMTSWNELVKQAPGVVTTFVRGLASPAAPVLLNAFAARYVAEAKTTLALLHASLLASRLRDDERALIERRVPWTVRLERDATAAFEGDEWPLDGLVRERRRDLVLKQPYDIRGDGVTVGIGSSDQDWQQAVEAAWNTGAVLQRYVAPCRYPVRRIGSADEQNLKVSLDAFVFSGRLVGLGAKASEHHKVNVFQGGSKLAVVVVNGRERKPAAA